MIERYTLPAMGRVWSEDHKYELWCQVERLVLEAQAKAGTVPAGSVDPVLAAPPPTPQAVAEREAVTEHDVIAFLSAWADNTTPREAAAYVHYGMTSSDLLDTALALQLTEATDLLIGQGHRADRGAARARPGPPGHAAGGPHARHPRRAGRVGAPGGRLRVRAGPRHADRLARARDAVAVGKLSGPVGTLLQHRPGHRGRRSWPSWACGPRTWPPRSCSATASPSG